MNALSKSNTSKLAAKFSAALLSVICFALIANTAHAGSVDKMLRKIDLEIIDGESYVVVDIECSGETETRQIVKKDKTRLWCAKRLPELCSKNQINVATRVCSRKFEERVKAYNQQQANPTKVAEKPAAKTKPIQSTPAPTARPSATPKKTEPKPVTSAPAPTPANAIEREKTLSTQTQSSVEQKELEVEQQRIQVERQRINLRRKELELQKRELLKKAEESQ